MGDSGFIYSNKQANKQFSSCVSNNTNPPSATPSTQTKCFTWIQRRFRHDAGEHHRQCSKWPRSLWTRMAGSGCSDCWALYAAPEIKEGFLQKTASCSGVCKKDATYNTDNLEWPYALLSLGRVCCCSFICSCSVLVWAVSQHTDTSKNTKAWSVS